MKRRWILISFRRWHLTKISSITYCNQFILSIQLFLINGGNLVSENPQGRRIHSWTLRDHTEKKEEEKKNTGLIELGFIINFKRSLQIHCYQFQWNNKGSILHKDRINGMIKFEIHDIRRVFGWPLSPKGLYVRQGQKDCWTGGGSVFSIGLAMGGGDGMGGRLVIFYLQLHCIRSGSKYQKWHPKVLKRKQGNMS